MLGDSSIFVVVSIVLQKVDRDLRRRSSQGGYGDHKSLDELLRELAGERVERERRRVFEAEARRQSLLIAARADDPNSDEAEAMGWIEGVADTEGWRP